MNCDRKRLIGPIAAAALLCSALPAALLPAAEPPAVNPFAKRPAERDDAVPGCVELSDGSIHPGMIYLTRDKRLQLYDDKLQRQREIPLSAVKQIDCSVKREWMEREWRFKETTSDEKVYTGRSYPAREYVHTITLQDGRKLTGPLSAIIYVQPKASGPARTGEERPQPKAEQFLLNKRNKGSLGQDLKSLIYVKRIKLEGRSSKSEARNPKP